jgi:N-acetylglucosaminyl-diphospho-decaprenol L-rhamnosyltransferase
VGRDLAVVVVTYNSAGDLPECLRSVFEAGKDLDLHVVVCDSGSTDDGAAVARRFEVTYLSGGDEGFARACNRALALESVRRSRYVLFLNPDTMVRSGSLAELLGRCDGIADRRLFTVRQVDAAGRLVHSLRRFPGPGAYLGEAVPVGPLARRREKIVDAEVYERESGCDWAMGSFLLVPGAALAELGGFDERFFLYSEEVDLCRRARERGWTVTYLPSLTIVHKGQSRVRDRRRATHQARAKLIYAEKWMGRRERLLMRAALVLHYARASVRSRSPEARRSARAALGAALFYRSPPSPTGRRQPRV